MADLPLIPVHPVLGGYWKCEDCGSIIEDELYICPECNEADDGIPRLKSIREKQNDLDAYIGVNGITLDQQEEMRTDIGYKG